MTNEMRLIDANQLPKQNELLIGRGMTAIVPYIAIENAPTIEAEPVVHGYWEHEEGALFHCTACGYVDAFPCEVRPHNYCPNCGAKMGQE